MMKPSNLFTLLALLSPLLVGCGSSQMFLTPEHEKKIETIYNEKLSQWTQPMDTVRIRTQYGTTHVTISGDKHKPSIILLHAMGITSMMWLDNVDSLSKHFRVYAVDMLGDIGKSRLYDKDENLDDAEKITAWIDALLDSLRINKASFAGASYGGWSAMHYARQRPERVEKVALLGPMGIARVSLGVVFKILSMIWFPTETKRAEMIDWTLGTNPNTRKRFVEHMRVATECRGFLATPWELDDDELAEIEAPVLLLLGEYDTIVQPSDEAKARAERCIKNIDAHILASSGHLMNTDAPQTVNALLVQFFLGEKNTTMNSRHTHQRIQ